MKMFIASVVSAALWLGVETSAQAQLFYVAHYQPVTVYSPPAPCLQTVYYAPAQPVYQPVARVRTRFRPFLGGTVTRVRYGYAPAYYAPAPVVVGY